MSSLTNTPPSDRGQIYPLLFPQRCPSSKWENLAFHTTDTYTHTFQHSNCSDRITVRVELLHFSDLCLLVSWNDSCLWVPCSLAGFYFLPWIVLFLTVKWLFVHSKCVHKCKQVSETVNYSTVIFNKHKCRNRWHCSAYANVLEAPVVYHGFCK